MIYIADHLQLGAGNIVTKDVHSHAVVICDLRRVIKRFGLNVMGPDEC